MAVKQPFRRATELDSVRKIIDDESPVILKEALVITVSTSGAATVQMSGSSQNLPAEVVRGLTIKPADRVFMIRSTQINRWFIFAVMTISSLQGNQEAASQVLLAPSTQAAQPMAGAICYQWVASGVRSDLIYQVEVADDNIETNATFVYIAGSTYILFVTTGTTKYFRVRSVDNSFRTSGWSPWSNATAA